MFREAVKTEILRVVQKFPHPKGALLPALFIVQRELGFITPEIMKGLSELLNVPAPTIKGAVSFYTLYQNKPMGRHIIRFCTNISCMIAEDDRLTLFFKEKYDLEFGGTTHNGRFSLLEMECLGACASGPVMLVNDDFYDHLTEKRITTILEKYS